jgi:hypothetical protein
VEEKAAATLGHPILHPVSRTGTSLVAKNELVQKNKCEYTVVTYGNVMKPEEFFIDSVYFSCLVSVN